jgi:hypothetical protein
VGKGKILNLTIQIKERNSNQTLNLRIGVGIKKLNLRKYLN